VVAAELNVAAEHGPPEEALRFLLLLALLQQHRQVRHRLQRVRVLRPQPPLLPSQRAPVELLGLV
jgi:hypothetical protein